MPLDDSGRDLLRPLTASKNLSKAESDEKHVSSVVYIGLLAVILVFVALETFVALRTPAYESADEPGHVQNIETLVNGHWYGMNAPCRLNAHIGLLQCAGDEAQQAPLYYIAMAAWQRATFQPALPPFDQRHVTIDPAFFRDKSGIFAHHSSADLRFLLWLRLPNIFLGVLTIVTTFFAARLVARDSWTPLVAASFLAFLPRMMFLWPFVTNDNLVNLLGAVFAYTVLRFVISPGRGRMALVGLVFGALLDTKLSTFPLVLVLFALACVVPGWRRRAVLLSIGSGTALAVSGWYFIQNWVRYGDPLARNATAHYLSKIGGLGVPIGQPYVVTDPLKFIFIEIPQRVDQTFWYLSGWNQFHWSWPVNVTFTLVLVVTLLGLLRIHGKRRILMTLGVIWVASLLSVWGVALQSYYQARYAYVGLPALAVLVALGDQRWRIPSRFLLPAMGLVGTLVAVQIDVLAIHWS